MLKQAKKAVQIAIIALGLLAVTFLASTSTQAQSAHGSLRISFVVVGRLQLQVDEAAGRVTLHAPGATTTLPSPAGNSLSLEAADTSEGEMTPVRKPALAGSPLAVNLVIFAK